MDVHIKQPPHFVGFAFDEEADVHDLLFVDDKGAFQGHRIDLHTVAIDIRIKNPTRLCVTEKVQALGRSPGVFGPDNTGGRRREKFYKEGNQVDQNRDDPTDHRQFVSAELPPHQLPLGRDGNAALRMLEGSVFVLFRAGNGLNGLCGCFDIRSHKAVSLQGIIRSECAGRARPAAGRKPVCR